MHRLLLSLIFLVFAGPSLASTPDCPIAVPAASISRLVQETNQIRKTMGRATLQLDPALSLAAQRHACDLAKRQVVSHRNKWGTRPMARIRKAGFRACFSAENVAQGTKSAHQTVGAWNWSPGHARNQQDKRAHEMGFGVAKGEDGLLYWVGVYATDCKTRTAEKAATRGFRPFSW